MSWYTVCPGGGRWLLTLPQPCASPDPSRASAGQLASSIASACGRGRGTVPATVPQSTLPYSARGVAPRETPPRHCDLSVLPIAPQRSRRAPRRCSFICHYFTCARDDGEDGPKQGLRRALAACRGVCAHHCPPRPVESRPRHPIHDRQPPIPQAIISLPISHHAHLLHGRLSAAPARSGGAQAMNSHTERPVHVHHLIQGSAGRERAPQLAARTQA